MKDLLSVPLGHMPSCVPTVPRHRPPFYDGAGMYLTINRLASYVWVCTYSASSRHKLLPQVKITRLIYCLGEARATKKVRYVDIHTKLFILFNGKSQPVGAFIGSQNLVSPSTHNLMFYITDPKHLEFCVDYFNTLWK